MLSTKTKDSILRQLAKTHTIQSKKDEHISDTDDEAVPVDVDGDVLGLVEGIRRISSYTYLGDASLDASMPQTGTAHLVRYRVITSAIQPFLSFDMAAGEAEVSLPVVDMATSSWKPADGVYQGHYTFEGNTYIFVEMQGDHNVRLYSVDDAMIPCTVDDICNTGKVYNMSVSAQTRKFFLQNDQFIRLVDNNGELVDVPATGYFGSYWKRIAVTAALGPFVMTPYASLGPYYYFSEYSRALRFAVGDWSKGEIGKSRSMSLTRDDTSIFTKGGIVKFALFLGRSKVLLNRDIDPDDDAEFTSDFAKRSDFVNATMKIRDNDGKWTKEYDSAITTAYPGFGKLDEIQDLDPQVVLRSYSQQAPVSYVYIDTSDVEPTGDSWKLFTYEKARLL